MKQIKKLLGTLLAVIFCIAAMFTAVPVMAADATTGNSLTIHNTGNTAHTFELYQIFTGDYSNEKLTNIEWGNGVKESGKETLGTAEEKAKTLTDEAAAEAFSKELANDSYLTNATEATEAVNPTESYTFDNLAAGYYLVKDKDGSQEAGAYTLYLLQVVYDTTASTSTKLDVPTVVKKVKDVNDSVANSTTGWQDSADYDIGDTIPYQITGTMPSNIDKYNTYKYIFTDTMSKGLTYTAGSAKITIGDKDVTSSFTETVATDDSTTVTWSCDNLKGISGITIDANTQVVVTYNCTLNDNAVIGSAGNPNTVYLTFSNNPNKGGEGETGKTPEDKNIVFTYKVVVNKVDQNNQALAGAEFTLSKVKTDKTTETIKTFTLTGNDETDPTTFTANGLDDGTYVLKETKTPAEYNKIADQYFTITAEHDTTADNPALQSLSGDKLTGSAITFTPDKDAGSLTTNVVNKAGSTLPSTGGIGTRIFYAIGAILVAAAIALIVCKRRFAKKA